MTAAGVFSRAEHFIYTGTCFKDPDHHPGCTCCNNHDLNNVTVRMSVKLPVPSVTKKHTITVNLGVKGREDEKKR